MQKYPLEQLFAAMYHGKFDFANFAYGNPAENYEEMRVQTGSKSRVMQKPKEKLKAYLDFLNLFVFEFLPVNKDVVFSYRKGANAYQAVQRHADGRHFFLSDIANFFPSIGRDLVRTTLLAARDQCPVSDLERWIERVLDLVCVNDALPVGFSTSPSISNATLFPFDQLLLEHCQRHALVYTRYSDDLIVSAGQRADLADIEDVVAKLLKHCFGERIRLNQSKSKFVNIGSKVKLLGMVLLPNGKVSVDAKVKSEIEVLLHFYVKDREKFLDKVAGEAEKAEGRIAGFLNYINTVDQAYLDKLRRKFGVVVVDRFLHRSFG